VAYNPLPRASAVAICKIGIEEKLVSLRAIVGDLSDHGNAEAILQTVISRFAHCSFLIDWDDEKISEQMAHALSIVSVHLLFSGTPTMSWTPIGIRFIEIYLPSGELYAELKFG
jgi:hypothetical protein